MLLASFIILIAILIVGYFLDRGHGSDRTLTTIVAASIAVSGMGGVLAAIACHQTSNLFWAAAAVFVAMVHVFCMLFGASFLIATMNDARPHR